MNRNLPAILIAILVYLPALSQKVSGKLQFQQGQTVGITVDLKTTASQEAGGQAIDFTVNATALHQFKVTNTTDDNSTLHHEVKKITFLFNGMGQKRAFDSGNPKDLDGMFGKPVKDILSKSYDMIIDPAGKTLLVKPEKIELTKWDDRAAIVLSMLRDITAVVYPPKKNESSFFKILPDKETTINESWTENGVDSNGIFKTTYTLSSITDSTIVVDIKGTSSFVTKAEMMGMATSTTMNNTYTGTAIIDKATGIIREKKIDTTSSGSTEVMGGSVPVHSKTSIVIKVQREL